VPEQRHDEQQLFRERSRDPAARDALIERYLPLSRSLARRYLRGAEPPDDLEQVAALALIKAVDLFDADLGVAFSSYRDVGWTARPRGACSSSPSTSDRRMTTSGERTRPRPRPARSPPTWA
jgi:hypothetical protein